MQVGTQILIERMKTNPEEFQEGKISRWGKHLSHAREWLPEEDKQALEKAIQQMRMDVFNEGVLKELAGEAEPEKEEWLRYQAKERYAMGMTDPKGIFGNMAVESTFDPNTDSFKYTLRRELDADRS